MGHKPIQISILVFPECDPSIIYGVYDTLWFAGIEWVNGVTTGAHLFESRIVTAEPGRMRIRPPPGCIVTTVLFIHF